MESESTESSEMTSPDNSELYVTADNLSLDTSDIDSDKNANKIENSQETIVLDNSSSVLDVTLVSGQGSTDDSLQILDDNVPEDSNANVHDDSVPVVTLDSSLDDSVVVLDSPEQQTAEEPLPESSGEESSESDVDDESMVVEASMQFSVSPGADISRIDTRIVERPSSADEGAVVSGGVDSRVERESQEVSDSCAEIKPEQVSSENLESDRGTDSTAPDVGTDVPALVDGNQVEVQEGITQETSSELESARLGAVIQAPENLSYDATGLPTRIVETRLDVDLSDQSHRESRLRELRRNDVVSEEVVVGPSSDESDVDSEPGHREPLPHAPRKRELVTDLPNTVTTLRTSQGGVVYLVGTAHFSRESQEDVAHTILAVQPDIVMVELCKSRVNILQLDETTILEEAKNINLAKIRSTIQQNGVVQGVMYLLMLSMSAHLTKELGMAPGGEFRRAFSEAKRVPGCLVHLGDRPIQITLRRALASLSVWQKVRLTYHMLTSKEPISKEEVERCKQRDMLEEMLAEMTGDFPALSRVFVDERDVYMAHSLQLAASSVPCGASSPPVVVGIVGIGHVPGITQNFGLVTEADIPALMRIPPPSFGNRVIRSGAKWCIIGLVAWGCYRIAIRVFLPRLPDISKLPLPSFSSLPTIKLPVFSK